MPRDGLIANSFYIFLQASGLDTNFGPQYGIRASGLDTGYGFITLIYYRFRVLVCVRRAALRPSTTIKDSGTGFGSS